MTQVTLVAPAPAAMTPQAQAGQGAAAAAPEEFALALDQAIGAVLAGTDITQVFQVVNGGDKANAVASSWRAVALENLAAGSIPEGVLDAIRIKISPVGAKGGEGQGEGADKQDGQVEVATLLEYLASLLAPVTVPQQPLPVIATTDGTTDQAQAQAVAAAVQSMGAATGENAMAPMPDAAATTTPASAPEAAGAAQPLPIAPSGQDEVRPAEANGLTVRTDGADEAASNVTSQAKGDVSREEMPPVEKPKAAEQSAPKGESAKSPAKPGVESAPGQLEAVTVEASKGASVKTGATEVAVAKPRQTKSVAGADVPTAADAAPKTASQQTAAAQSAGLQGQAPVEAQVVQQDQAVSAKGQTKGDTDTIDSVQQLQSEGGTKASATRAAKSEEAAGANQERLIARIASAVTEAERSGRSVVRLRLYPPELGTVRIEVSSVRGTVSARIEASTQTTQGMLQSNLSTLRADLREAGVDMREMRVEFRDPSLAFGSQDRSAHRGSHEEERQSGRPRSERETERVEAVGALAQEAGVAGLNLYI